MGRFDEEERKLEESLQNLDMTTERFIEYENKNVNIKTWFNEETKRFEYTIGAGNGMIFMDEQYFLQIAEGVALARQKIENRNIQRLSAQHSLQLTDKSDTNSNNGN